MSGGAANLIVAESTFVLTGRHEGGEGGGQMGSAP